MYARVTTIQISPYRLDESIGILREQVAPAMQQQDGFKGYLMFVDRSTGKSINITLWEGEEDHLSLDAGHDARWLTRGVEYSLRRLPAR